MADNNLNPGQQRYNDLYSGQGSAGDRPTPPDGYDRDYSTPQDMSGARDHSDLHSSQPEEHSSLKSLEDQASQNQTTGRDISDTATAERQAGYETSGFKGGINGANKKQKARMSSFKKHAIAGGICFLAGGGLLTAIFTAISGPAQLIQAAEYLNDFMMDVVDMQQAVRSFRTANDIARATNSLGDGVGNAIADTRLSRFALKQANAMKTTLKNNGLEFHVNSFGQKNGATIDASKVFGGPLKDADLDSAADLLGISRNKITGIDGNGNLLLNDKLSYSEAKKMISAMDDPGKSKVISWFQTRNTLKRNGYISWLHPIQKTKAILWKKLTDALKDLISPISKGTNNKNNMADAAERIANDRNEGVDADKVDKDRGSKARQLADAFFDKTKGVGKAYNKVRGIYQNIMSNPLMKAGGIAMFVISVACIVQDLQEKAGPYKQQNVVNTAEKASSLLLGMGSQVKSGEDITMESAGMAVKAMLGDEVDVLDDNGNPTGQKTYSSFWQNPNVCKTLGQANCSQDDDTPMMLKDVSSGGFNFLDDAGNNMLEAIIGKNSPLGWGINAVCGVFDGINDAISNVIPGPIKALMDNIMNSITAWVNNAINAIFGQNAMATFFNGIIGIVYGQPLDLESALPSQYGGIATYGSHFTANDKSLNIGGKQLSDSQTAELRLEQRRYLAWRNNQKPLLARLADPTDYSSSVNQIARSINLNTSSQSLSTQLANVFRTFVSAPTIVANAVNQLSNGSAYAAATVDFGVPTFAYSADEMDKITSDDTQYDLGNNTKKAIELLAQEKDAVDNAKKNVDSNADKKSFHPWTNNNDDSTTQYHRYAQICMMSEISTDSSYKVEQINNEEGEWNYADFMDGGDNSKANWCKSVADQPEFFSIRLYIMDYNNTVASMCYNGDASDSDSTAACKEMGIESSSSGNSTDSSGNQSATAWQEKFKVEASGGVSHGYSTSYNGCTTISAWFINDHTTLNYGHGNGNQVVNQLVAANPGKNLQITSQPTKAPAIFSSNPPGINASSSAFGHTGLVTAVNEDGSIETLESGANSYMNGFSSPWSKTFTHQPSDFASNTQFVYVGDYLK